MNCFAHFRKVFPGNLTLGNGSALRNCPDNSFQRRACKLCLFVVHQFFLLNIVCDEEHREKKVTVSKASRFAANSENVNVYSGANR